jgi:hypothetical protein
MIIINQASANPDTTHNIYTSSEATIAAFVANATELAAFLANYQLGDTVLLSNGDAYQWNTGDGTTAANYAAYNLDSNKNTIGEALIETPSFTANAYTLIAANAGKLLRLANGANAQVNLAGLVAGQYVNFEIADTFEYTFASTDGITSDGSAAAGDNLGKRKGKTLGTMVTAVKQAGGEWTLVGKLST